MESNIHSFLPTAICLTADTITQLSWGKCSLQNFLMALGFVFAPAVCCGCANFFILSLTMTFE